MEKRYKSLVSRFVFMLLLCSVSMANAMVTISEGVKDFRVPISEIKMLDDSSHFSFQSISSNTFASMFTAVTSEDNFLLDHPYWLKFEIKNLSKTEKSWYLQLPLHAEKLMIYIVDTKGNYKEYITGQETDFYSRPNKIRTIVFDLPFENDQPLTVYLHTISKKHHDATFVVATHQDYIETHTKGYLVNGLIYGMLILMAIYNFIIYLSIKDKIYIYYILYIISSAFFISWKDGLGFQFLWPHTPQLNQYHHSLGLYLLMISFMLYANNFLELKTKYSKAYFTTFGIILLNTIFFLFNILDPSFFDPLPFLYLLSFLYFFVLAVYFTVQGYLPARYLLITLSCTLTALLVIKLRYLGWLEWNWFIEHILTYAVVIDAIVMSLAIRDKLVYLRRAKEKAMAEMFIEEQQKAESELVQLRNNQLESEIVYKNNELSILATNLAQNNELFSSLKRELLAISKEAPTVSSLNKLIRDIDKGSEFDNNWEQFQLNFDKAHHNFLSKLRERFPSLKSTDLLFCAYLKLNKSNKEIASLLNMTISAVEKRRFRLREKLLLDNDVTLTDYLANLK